MPIKEAVAISKTILRNGFDAYIINANLQDEIIQMTNELALDIACEADFDTLSKLFPHLEEPNEEALIAVMTTESNLKVRFYPITANDCAHPDFTFMRISPHMLKVLEEKDQKLYTMIKGTLFTECCEDVFEDRSTGHIRLKGVASRTLQRDYGLAITALRMAANHDLPIESSTWLAIIRSSHQIADYVPMAVFVKELRMVAAENLWKFIQLLSDSFILHALLPEVAALHAVKQHKNKSDATEVTVFDYTIESMKQYAQDELSADWIGTLAMLFHAIGKLYCAENYQGRWTFYQYHRIGAQVTRGILNRLNFPPDEVDLICSLVRNHIRFHSMLTDKGIRRLLALPDSKRIIEMTRAIIKASASSYTNFNHNLKYLERADTPETMLEPFLNGNEIMEITSLPQGPTVGLIRDALLDAQKAGNVTNMEDAISFVREYTIGEE